MKYPFLSAAETRKLTEQFPTPFHVYSEQIIRERARELKAAFAWNAGFREYFAVKATPNPAILRLLMEEGCGLDCSSYTELLLAGRCGAKGDDIMFSSNMTPREDMVEALRQGAIINLDDYTHIDFLCDCAAGLPGGKIPATICCRYNPGNSFTIGNTIMSRPGDAKYGFTREQLFAGFMRLRELGVQRFGLHAFLSSNTADGRYYPELAALLFGTAAELQAETGIALSFVNLSGGVGIPYRPEETAVDMAAVGEAIRQHFAAIMEPAGLGDCALFSELGRWLLAPAGMLVCTAIHHKHIYKRYIGVDACSANLMRPALYGAYHHITVAGKEDAACTECYDIAGGLCENSDKFAIDRQLPPIVAGDLLCIHDTGAHGHSMGYNYNGKLRSAEVLWQQDGRARLIRRAETPADYFATLEF